jgi:hypothetical protein
MKKLANWPYVIKFEDAPRFVTEQNFPLFSKILKKIWFYKRWYKLTNRELVYITKTAVAQRHEEWLCEETKPIYFKLRKEFLKLKAAHRKYFGGSDILVIERGQLVLYKFTFDSIHKRADFKKIIRNKKN